MRTSTSVLASSCNERLLRYMRWCSIGRTIYRIGNFFSQKVKGSVFSLLLHGDRHCVKGLDWPVCLKSMK